MTKNQSTITYYNIQDRLLDKSSKMSKLLEIPRLIYNGMIVMDINKDHKQLKVFLLNKPDPTSLNFNR